MPRLAMRGLTVLVFCTVACVLNSVMALAQPFPSYEAPGGPYADSRSGGGYRPTPPAGPRHPTNYSAPNVPDNRRPPRLEAPAFGQQATPHGGPARQPPTEQRQVVERTFFEPAQIVARVGDQPIFYGELQGTIEQILAPHKDKASEWELEQAREKLIKQMLTATIDNKLRYLDFLRSFPEQSQIPEIMNRVDKQFYENHLPKLIERTKVANAAELDAKMRLLGTSLELSRLRFREQVLAQQAVQQKIDMEPEVTHYEMLDFYRKHAEDYEIPAKVRWEQLMVRFDKFPSKQEAWQAISEMGNRVYLGGAPLYAVAKESSQGFNADEGGYHDWTNRGSLAADEIDKAIFNMPVGQLSRVIETDLGLHIVRVIERRDTARIPFTEAQVEIKKKLRDEKIEKATQKYIANLRTEIDVWTIFDDKESTASSENKEASGNVFRPAGSY